MKIIFFTGHMAGMPRKANVTLLADAYSRSGQDVYIFTTGYSLVSELIKDQRCGYAKTRPMNRWYTTDDAFPIKGYIHRPVINPGRFPTALLNTLTAPFFRYYSSQLPKAVIAELKDADIIFVESGAGLLYAGALKKRFPNAKIIYQASDSLITLQVHPVIMEAEKKYMPIFDLIVYTAQSRATESGHQHAYYIPQAIDTDAFNVPTENPYPKKNNIVSVGDMLFDPGAIMALAKAAPDWTIHLFGADARCPEPLPNIVTHGEVPFQVTVPYIMHADIGIAPYRAAKDAAYLSQSSLKMKQYTYAKLPIIAPDFAAANYPHVMAYNPHNPSSIAMAFERARCYDRTSISKAGIMSWTETAQRILGALHMLPPPDAVSP